MSYIFQLAVMYSQIKYYCSKTYIALYGKKNAIKNASNCINKAIKLIK